MPSARPRADRAAQPAPATAAAGGHPRSDALQVLRGAACLLVVGYHLGSWEAAVGLPRGPLRPLAHFGYAGVDLFFVLSGYIIAVTNRSALGTPGKLPGYLFRRASRIYPTYWVALAIEAAARWALPRSAPPFRWTELVLLPDGLAPRYFMVAWTLCYEVMFYLAFGLLFLVPRRFAGPGLLGWAAVVAWWTATSRPLPQNPASALAVSPLVLEFLAGCLLAWVPVRLTRMQAAGALALAAAWCAVGSTSPSITTGTGCRFTSGPAWPCSRRRWHWSYWRRPAVNGAAGRSGGAGSWRSAMPRTRSTSPTSPRCPSRST